jgi:hypothetical protein
MDGRVIEGELGETNGDFMELTVRAHLIFHSFFT